MKTKYCSVEDLMLMGKLREVGLGDAAIKNVPGGQLTIYKISDVRDKQMSLYDILPKNSNKKKVKLLSRK